MDRIVKLQEVQTITGLSRSVIYRLLAQGAFPAQVDTGARMTAWKRSAVQEWVASCGTKAATV
ncbi:hypothetical protein C0Z16_20840 [Paraburkholderia rhynchosiae]|nr:hypothetical protein C0Z16_20840 [Paraburkholderia rhynchosiae]